VLFVTPEYNRSIPGALKNAIDWASRPWGENSFDHIPAAVIGASIGQIGTAMGQQSLRGVLSFCNARQMTSPEAYIQYSPMSSRTTARSPTTPLESFSAPTWPSSAPTSAWS
jgi:chromate reductase